MRKVAPSYEWGDKEFRFNQLLFMDDFRLFVKNQYQMDSPVKTAYFFREVIRMAFGVSKCGVVLLKRELNYKTKLSYISKWTNGEKNL